MCKSASQAVLSRMQLTLHATRLTPHGASRLVQAMSAWSVKTRHAPSRHCRDARVYDHTTTAMHEIEYTPPSLMYGHGSEACNSVYPIRGCWVVVDQFINACNRRGRHIYMMNVPLTCRLVLIPSSNQGSVCCCVHTITYQR